jgi:hypothetical protein
MLTGKQITEEWKKCFVDKSRIYMIEHYLTTYDATQHNTVPFILFPKQKELVISLGQYSNNITTKPRQAGISTTVSAFIACELSLAQKTKPETVLIVANKLDLSKLDLKKIKDFLLQIPRWFWGSEYYGSQEKESRSIFILDNQKELMLFNGCGVHAVSSGENAARGVSSVSWLIFDEAAFIEKGKSVYSQAAATTATGGKIIMISTPNGKDELYYDVYNKAKKKENDFNLIELKWYQDPRYNKFLEWHYYDKEIGDTIIENESTLNENGDIEWNPDKWANMEQRGFKPTAPWYINMCNKFNQNKQRIAQELDVSFLGSAGTVVDTEIIEFHEKTNVREPLYFDKFFKEAWIFKKPIEGHRYLMPADVSTGSGDDSSVIHIIDIDSIDDNGIPCIEQVFEYQGKIQGDILGELIDKYGRYYGNALAIVDCIGSSGDAAVLKLQSLEYPNMYYDDQSLKDVTNSIDTSNENKKIPGVRSIPRLQMIMNLEKCLRFNEIMIRSIRFIQELQTWIWKNGRPDHQSGFHDDTLTSMAMGLYVLQFSFKRLQAVKEKNKVVLDSMIIAQNAINGIGSVILNDNAKKIPLPFYMSGMSLKSSEDTIKVDIKSREQIEKEKIIEQNKILNKYLLSKLNQYIR